MKKRTKRIIIAVAVVVVLAGSKNIEGFYNGPGIKLLGILPTAVEIIDVNDKGIEISNENIKKAVANFTDKVIGSVDN